MDFGIVESSMLTRAHASIVELHSLESESTDKVSD